MARKTRRPRQMRRGERVWILPGRAGDLRKKATVVSHDPWTGMAVVRRRGRKYDMQACDLQVRGLLERA